MTDNDKREYLDKLRIRAEEILQTGIGDIKDISHGDVQKIIQELHTYEIELELQNEELRNAQIEIEESQTKYLDLYDFAPVGYLTLDNKGIILEINLCGAKMLGIERSKLVNRGFTNFISSEYHNETISHYRKVRETGLTQSCELKIVKKDGTSSFIMLTSNPIKSDNNEVWGIRSTFADITEQKRQEIILKTSEKNLKETQRLACVGNWVWDVKTGKVEWSDVIYKIFGVDPKSFSTNISSIMKLFHPDDQDMDKRLVEHATRSREQYSFESRIQRPDGRIRYLISTSIGSYDENGNLIQITGAVQDITEQQIARLELQESEKQLKRIMEGTNDGFWEWKDIEKDEGWWSPKFYEILGYKDKEFRPSLQKFTELVHPEDRKNITSNIKLHLKSDQPFDTEYRIQTKSGEYIWLRVKGQAFFDEKGKPKGMAGSVRDITEEKKAQEEILQIARFPKENPNPVMGIGKDGKILYTNDASSMLLEFWKCKVGETLSYEYKDLVSKALNGNEVQEIELSFNDRTYVLMFTPVKELDSVNIYGVEITRRKKAEESLRNREFILNETGRMARIGGWEHDLVTGKALWTKALFDIIEIESGNPPGVNEHLNYYPPKYRRILEEAYWKSVTMGEPFDLELQAYTAKGKLIWCRVTGEPAFRSGANIKMRGTFQDITERKIAELERNEANLRLRMSLEASNVGLWDWNLKENTIYLSREWKKQIGYDENEIETDFGFWEDNLNPEDRDRVLQYLNDYLDGKFSDYNIEYRLKHKNGSYIWIYAKGQVLRDIDGKPERMLGCHIDITKQKESEEQIRRSEARLLESQATAHVGTWEYNIETDNLWWSDELYRIFGIQKQEIVDSQTLRNIIHPDDVGHFMEEEASGSTYHSDYRIVKPDGEIRWIHEEVGTETYKDGKTYFARGTAQDITEQKQAEDELRSQQAFERNLINTAQMIILVLDKDGKILRINPYMEQLSGYSFEEVSGKDWFSTFLPGKRIEQTRKLFLKAIDDIHTVGNIDTIISKGGKEFLIEWYDNTLKDKDGNTVGLLAVGQDVTERKKAEEALSKSEMQFRSVWEKATDGMRITDEKGIVIMANDAYCKMMEKPGEEIIGKPLSVVYEPEHHSHILKKHNERFRSRTIPPYLERSLVLWNGKKIYFEVSNVLLENPNQPAYSLSIFRDVTEMKMIQEELRRERNLLERIMETSPVGITVVDKNGQITFANAYAEKLFDLTKKEITQRTYDAPEWKITDYHGNPIPEEELPFNKVMETGESVFEVEHAIEKPDGTQKMLSINASPLFDESGEFKGIIAIILDITERKKSSILRKVFAELGLKMTEADSFEKLSESIAEAVDELMGFDAFLLTQRLQGSDMFSVEYAVDIIEGKRKHVETGVVSIDIYRPLGNLLNGEPYLLNRTSFDNAEAWNKFGDVSRLSASLMFAPVVFGNEVYGMISAQSYKQNYYDESDLQVLQLIAGSVAPTIKRIQTEIYLRQSESLLKATQSLTKIGGWEYNLEQDTLFWTEETYRIHGYEPYSIEPGTESHIESSIKCYDPADRSMILDAFNKCVKEGVSYDIEVPFTKIDGQKIWIRTAASAVYREKDIIKVVGCLMDITERKKGEQALRESEEKYRLIVDTQTDLIVKTDKDLKILYVSPSYCEKFGENEKELIGKYFELKIREKDISFTDAVKKLDKPPYTCSVENCVKTMDGWRWISWSAYAILDKSGKIDSIVIDGRDINSQKLAENALKASESMYRRAIGAANGVPYQWEYISRTFSFVGDGIKKLTGYAPDEYSLEVFRSILQAEYFRGEVVGMTTEEIYDPKNLNKLGLFQADYEIIDYYGNRKWISDSAILIKNEKGEVFRSLGILQDITERKLIENELRESQRRLMEIFQTIGLVAVMLDSEGNITFANKFLLNLTGWTEKEILGKSWFEKFIDTDNLEEVKKVHRKAVKDDKYPKHYENFIVTRSGEHRLIRWNNSILRDIDGKAIGSASIGEDITELIQYEKFLKERLSFQNTLLDTIANPVFYKDLDGKYLGCNRAFEEYFGTKRDEVVGKTVFDIAPKRIAQKYLEKDKELFKYPGYQFYEWKVVNKSGEIRDVIFNKATFKDEEGNVAGIVGIITDITARIRAEERFRKSAEVSNDILYEWDVGEDTLEWFGGLEELLGYEKGEIEYSLKGWMSLIHPDDLKRLKNSIKRHRTSVEPINEEYRMLRKDGTWAYWADRATPILNDKGKPVRWIGGCTDITIQKTIEEELRDSQEKLRNLTSHIDSLVEKEKSQISQEIHDQLGQALTALKLDLSWLSKRYTGDQDTLLAKTQNMMKLIDETSYVVKSISSRLRPGLLDDLGFAAAVEWLLDEFQNRTDIKCRFIKKPKEIDVSEEHAIVLFRIFQEALTNIARHSKASRVTVTLSRKDDRIKLRITDNGVGITQDQIDNQKSLGVFGMGERALSMDGTMEIVGEEEKGTTVIITIPEITSKKV